MCVWAITGFGLVDINYYQKKKSKAGQTESRAHKLQQEVMNCIKVICFELPFQGCCAASVPSGNSCTCVSERQETSNYSSYYMAIQEKKTDKRTCFMTGSTVQLTARQTRRHAADSQRGERGSETQAD